MADNVYNPGLRHAGAYIASGYPFVKTYTINKLGSGISEQEVNFQGVTKQIIITNTESSANRDLRVHFLSTGSASGANIINNLHYYNVPNNSSLTLNTKSKQIYLSNASGGSITFSVFASTTHIVTGSMYALTGSGIDE